MPAGAGYYRGDSKEVKAAKARKRLREEQERRLNKAGKYKYKLNEDNRSGLKDEKTIEADRERDDRRKYNAKFQSESGVSSNLEKNRERDRSPEGKPKKKRRSFNPFKGLKR